MVTLIFDHPLLVFMRLLSYSTDFARNVGMSGSVLDRVVHRWLGYQCYGTVSMVNNIGTVLPKTNSETAPAPERPMTMASVPRSFASLAISSRGSP